MRRQQYPRLHSRWSLLEALVVESAVRLLDRSSGAAVLVVKVLAGQVLAG